jgi:hypothetical protein
MREPIDQIAQINTCALCSKYLSYDQSKYTTSCNHSVHYDCWNDYITSCQLSKKIECPYCHKILTNTTFVDISTNILLPPAITTTICDTSIRDTLDIPVRRKYSYPYKYIVCDCENVCFTFGFILTIIYSFFVLAQFIAGIVFYHIQVENISKEICAVLICVSCGYLLALCLTAISRSLIVFITIYIFTLILRAGMSIYGCIQIMYHILTYGNSYISTIIIVSYVCVYIESILTMVVVTKTKYY